MDRIERQGLKNLRDRLRLTVICGSCEKILQRGDPENVTHGICPPCYKELMDDLVSRGMATKDEAEKSLNKIKVAEMERESQPSLF